MPLIILLFYFTFYLLINSILCVGVCGLALNLRPTLSRLFSVHFNDNPPFVLLTTFYLAKFFVK